MNKDLLTLLGGFLTALLMFFGTVGIAFEWFIQDSINAFVILVGALAALVINGIAVWKNTFVSRKAQIQKKALQSQGLMEK
ncbi:hypothetical protein M4D55_23505 [Metabacillus idriensis]|uniref:phage holin n=1 Tax=Metabacillus idriensis TaxID=324768 RepID=UPI002040BB57|nr:phage holin [Metabacillus idriensis]MCM3598730.1 hypothetical protein [Metabacillus idriensis]